MNLDNVVLVRAMDRLPIMGMLFPPSKGLEYQKAQFNEYFTIINKIVKEKLEKYIGRTLDLANNEDKKMFNNIVMFWYPLIYFHTTTLHFAFNGLLDADDLFRLAIIDPIKNHQIDDYINVDNIGVTTKGTFKVSKDAIFVISENYYKSLSLFLRDDLAQNYKFEIFTGSLKEAVQNTLKKYNYPVLPLTKKENNVCFGECMEKESMLEFQDSFAKMVNASRLSIEELATKPVSEMNERDLLSAEKVKVDIEKKRIIEKYYLEKFYNLLISKAEAKGAVFNLEEKELLFVSSRESEVFIEKLINIILQEYGGLNGLKYIVDEFNDNIFLSKLSDEQIFALAGESRK